MAKKKSYCVLGMGEFGQSVALTMMHNGYEVLAVDKRMDKVQLIADQVTRAVRADASNPEVVKGLGVDMMDGVIVAIGESLEASILATISAKECGAPYVLAKANTDIEEKVLRRVGADEVVFPERAMGVRIGQNLTSGNFFDVVELSDQFSVVEMKIPDGWKGKSLRELCLRAEGLNVIGRRDGDELVVSLDPNEPMREDATYIVVGSNDSLIKAREEP